MIIEQNENTCLIRYLLLLFLCFFVSAAFFVIPVSADSSDFLGQPCTSSNSPFHVTSAVSDYSFGFVDNPFYLSAYAYNGSDGKLIVASQSQNTHFTFNGTTYELNKFNSYTGLYYISPVSVTSNGLNIGFYSNETQALIAIKDAIDNPSGPAVDPHDLSFTLPAGNVIFLETDLSLR